MNYEYIPAGAHPSLAAEPGDFLLVHGHTIISRLIQFGEWLRFRAGDRWTHMATLETSDTIIEAVAQGVVRTPLAFYDSYDRVLDRSRLDGHDVPQTVTFLRSCLGQPYGVLTFIGIALRILTPGRGLWLGLNGTEICSGLGMQAQTRGWVIPAVDPASMTPAEVAELYGVPARIRDAQA